MGKFFKTAKTEKEETSKNISWARPVAAVGGLLVGSFPGLAVNSIAYSAHQQKLKYPTKFSPEENKAIKKEFKRQVKNTGARVIKDPRPHYRITENKIGIPKHQSASAFHELGHAKAYKNKTYKRYMVPGRSFGPGVSSIGNIAQVILPEESNVATTITTLGQTPMLIDEGRANWNVYRTAKKMKLSPKGMKAYRRSALTSMISYGGVAAVPIFANIGARKFKMMVKGNE